VLLIKQVKRTFALLDSKNQKKFIFLTALQMCLGFFDLVAIFFVGLFSYCASAYLGISVLPESLSRYLNLLGFPINDLAKSLVYLISIAVSLMVSKSVLSLLILKRTFHFLANRSAEISETTSRRFLFSSYKVISGISSQEAAYAVSGAFSVGEILGAFTVILSEMVMLTLLASFILFADPVLAILLIAYFALLYLLSQKKLGTWTRANSKVIAESNFEGDQVIQDGISLYKELFITNNLNFVINSFAKYRWKIANSTANLQLVAYIPKMTFESALIVGTCLVGIEQVIVNTTESAIATVVMFLAAGTRILPSLLRVQAATSTIQSMSGGSEVAFKLVRAMDADSSHRIPSVASLKSKHVFSPSVCIENLNFRYSDQDKFTIKNLSLTIPVGSSLAIVGKTGSGKSTLVDLILGVLSPDSGSIEISNLDPFTAIQTWPGSIGYVPQVVAFVNGTVRENVGIGLAPSTSSDDLIWECLRMAQLDALFKESNEGLNTLIGERGIKLSGGQRQRLGIARALYSKPQLLILDEATSALDAETEHAIAETIHNLSLRITLVVIAHRIATVKEMNNVIYLDGGKIIAEGTFDEVRTAIPQFERQAKLLGL
jgi:ATP-binding cassette subfamily C protein